MNKGMQNNSGGNTSSLPSVEEQMLRIEDNNCLKFNLPSIYQLKEVISNKVKQIKNEEEQATKKSE